MDVFNRLLQQLLCSRCRARKIRQKDIMLLLRRWVTLLSSGVALAHCLQTLCHSTKRPAMRALLNDVYQSVNQGHALSAVLKKYPNYFDALSCQWIAAGELSGSLADMLAHVALHQEKTTQLRSRLKKALFYPCAVVVVAFVVTGVLLMVVVPQFAELFSGFGGQLPYFTQCVLTAAHGVRRFGLWAALGVGLGVWAFSRLKRRYMTLARHWSLLWLHVPGVSSLIKSALAARFARALSTIVVSGIPVLEGLQSLAAAESHVLFREAIWQIKEVVLAGQPLHRGMQMTGLFPQIAIEMVAIGEEAGKLGEMLGRLADFYEQDVARITESCTQLLEPCIMVILGVVIGGLVIAMYLPIFKLGAVV